MAVPKKKVSLSKKKIRLNSTKFNRQNYIQCSSCLEYIKVHRLCINGSCTTFSKDYSTNIIKQTK